MKRLICLTAVITLTACAGAPRYKPDWATAIEKRPDCASATASDAMAAATRFIQKNTVGYKTGKIKDAGSPVLERMLKRDPNKIYTTVISYPDTTDQKLAGRSFIYDDALVLLWHISNHDCDTAAGIANTLMLLQNDDGSWGFSFNATGDFYNARYIRSGTVAWAAYALARYGKSCDNASASSSSERGSRWLSGRIKNGLVERAYGGWSQDYTYFAPAFDFTVQVAEHQFDTWMAFEAAGRLNEAESLKSAIMSGLWIEDQGRFAVAIADGKREDGRALDAAGAWGGLWLLAVGGREKAARSMRFTITGFSVSDGPLRGFKPYLDPVDGPLDGPMKNLIFFEGTMAAGLLSLRLGERETAIETVRLGTSLACVAGGGIPYASKEVLGFESVPAVAATIWFMILIDEFSGTARAPVFQ